jgi:uncharacterized protein (TIRG00374 family)
VSKKSGNLLKILVSFGLLVILFRQVGWKQTWETLIGTQWSYLSLAMILYLAGVGVRAYRWHLLLQASGMNVPLKRLVVLYFVGTFFSNVLPTGIGGDAVRMYELYNTTQRSAESISTVLLDRATGLLMLFLIALVALPFSHRLIPPSLVLVILVLCAGSWMGTALIFHRGWLEKTGILRIITRFGTTRKIYEAITACGFKAVGGALGISFLFNGLLIAVNYLIALSVGVRIPFEYFLLFIPLISFLLLLPFSVSGLGIREGGYVYLFAYAGVPSALALSMSLLFYALNVATGLIGGIMYILEGAWGMGGGSS